MKLLIPRNERHKPAELPELCFNFPIFLVDELQLLRVVLSYRNNHAPAFGELVNQLNRQFWSRRRNDDGVVGRELRKSSSAVSHENGGILISHRYEQHAG